MFYQLPPAGNPVYLRRGADAADTALTAFPPWSARFYQSGTAALAAALIAAARRRNVTAPEVILPAYGCPDLVSASIHAGVRPVLVDLEAGRPWLALDQIEARICPNTVAIVAVHLFGIPERIKALRRLTRQTDIVLIEDSAQLMPVTGGYDAWSGDLVVTSFGRGKPVNLLGGGGVLFRDPDLGQYLPVVNDKADPSAAAYVRFGFGAVMYNVASLPWFYWIPLSLPFLHLGETRFQPLGEIVAMDPVRRMLLPVGLHEYRVRDRSLQARLRALLARHCNADAGLLDLAGECGVPEAAALLRYPLLVVPERRNRLLRRLQSAGLGASCMYPAALPGVPGLEDRLRDQGPFPAADDFARRILTLPTHARIRERDLAGVSRILATDAAGP